MTPKEFIEKKLNDLNSTKKIVDDFKSDNELIEYIFKTIMSKKFRKFSVAPEYIPHIKEAITNNIKNNLPIKFTFPFGSFKLWRLEESPEADWAELFTLIYYIKWLKPITEVYKPGVLFDLSSDEIILERLNNIPKSDTEAYEKSFNMIISFLKKYLPKNMKFTITPVRSLYTTEEFEEDLKKEMHKIQTEFGIVPTINEKQRRAVEMNVKLIRGQEKDPFWREKKELLLQSYYNISRRRPYTRAKDKILVWFQRTKDGKAISVGSTKTSIVKFWIGIGILKKNEKNFIEYILSPSQINNNKFSKENISINGLNSKNFKTIKILN